jgi:hypothetical protein
MANISVPANRVWAALVEPEHVKEWLAVCRGGWAIRGQEFTLDFEDWEFFCCLTNRSVPPAARAPGTLEQLWRWVGWWRGGRPLGGPWRAARAVSGACRRSGDRRRNSLRGRTSPNGTSANGYGPA